jgi:hypothetical protein
MRPAEKRADPFYLSPEWRVLCAEIKRERWPGLLATKGHCCEDPECDAMHSRNARIFFHHIRERRDAPHLQLVKANIQCLCGSAHSRVTATNRTKRQQG